MQWIDSHCHLDAAEFDADRQAVWQAALAAGVGGLVVPAVEAANFETVRLLCALRPGCFPAFGIHPLYVDRAEEQDLEHLREFLCKGDAVAVGEIGLDHFVENRDEARQEWFFVEQLKIAREFDLPVLLHVRRAIDPILKWLRRYPVRGGIAHAFNGSVQQAEAFIALGFKLGFGGAMTWQRALKLRHLAATLPLTSIVLETDAPDIPPQFVGKGRNEPAHLPSIAQDLATLRGMELASLAEASCANVVAVLPGLGPVVERSAGGAEGGAFHTCPRHPGAQA